MKLTFGHGSPKRGRLLPGHGIIGVGSMAPPVLSAALADITETAQETGTIQVRLSDHFSGEFLQYSATGAGVVSVGSFSGILTLDKSAIRSGETITATARNAGGEVSDTFTFTINAVPAYAAPASVRSNLFNRESAVSGTTWDNDTGGTDATFNAAPTYSVIDGARAVTLASASGSERFITLPESIFAGADDATDAGRFNLAVTVRRAGQLAGLLGAANGAFGLWATPGSSTDHGSILAGAASAVVGKAQDDGTLTEILNVVQNSTSRGTVYDHMAAPDYWTFVLRGMKLAALAGVEKRIGAFYDTGSAKWRYSDTRVAAVTVWDGSTGITAGNATEKEVLKMHNYAARSGLVDTSPTQTGFNLPPVWATDPYIVKDEVQTLAGRQVSVEGYSATKFQPSDGDPAFVFKWYYADDTATTLSDTPFFTPPAIDEATGASPDVGRELKCDVTVSNNRGSALRSVSAGTVVDVQTITDLPMRSAEQATFWGKGADKATKTSIGFRDTDPYAKPEGSGSVRITMTADDSQAYPSGTLSWQVEPNTTYRVKAYITQRSTPGLSIYYGLGTSNSRYLHNPGGVIDSISSGGSAPELTIDRTITTGISQNTLMLSVHVTSQVAGGYIDVTRVTLETVTADKPAATLLPTGTAVAFGPEDVGTYYIDPIDGSDTSDGLSIAAARKAFPTTLAAGSTVYVKGGVNYPGRLVVTADGTNTIPTQVYLDGRMTPDGPFGSGDVLFDASKRLTGWTDNGDGTWSIPHTHSGPVHERFAMGIHQDDKRLWPGMLPATLPVADIIDADGHYYRGATYAGNKVFLPKFAELQAQAPLDDGECYVWLKTAGNNVVPFTIIAGSYNDTESSVLLHTVPDVVSEKVGIANHASSLTKPGQYLLKSGVLSVRTWDGASPEVADMRYGQGDMGITIKGSDVEVYGGNIQKHRGKGALQITGGARNRFSGQTVKHGAFSGAGGGTLELMHTTKGVFTDITIDDILGPNITAAPRGIRATQGGEHIFLRTHVERHSGSQVAFIGSNHNIRIGSTIGDRFDRHGNGMSAYAGSDGAVDLCCTTIMPKGGLVRTSQNSNRKPYGSQILHGTYVSSDSVIVSFHGTTNNGPSGTLLEKGHHTISNNIAVTVADYPGSEGRTIGLVNLENVHGTTVTGNIADGIDGATREDQRFIEVPAWGVGEWTILAPGAGYSRGQEINVGFPLEVLSVDENGGLVSARQTKAGSFSSDPLGTTVTDAGGLQVRIDASFRREYLLKTGNHYLTNDRENQHPTAGQAALWGETLTDFSNEARRAYFRNLLGPVDTWDFHPPVSNGPDLTLPEAGHWVLDLSTMYGGIWAGRFPQFEAGGIYEGGIPVTWAGRYRPFEQTLPSGHVMPAFSEVIDWENLEIAPAP